ncbi:MAG: hypothetical protein ABIN69_05245 [Aestuariivirga sp.]
MKKNTSLIMTLNWPPPDNSVLLTSSTTALREDQMPPLIAGNWKMLGMAPQLCDIDAVAVSVMAKPPSADILICLPSTLIAPAVHKAANHIAIGSVIDGGRTTYSAKFAQRLSVAIGFALPLWPTEVGTCEISSLGLGDSGASQ